MGFNENPQPYIKDIVKYAIKEEWKYPSYIPNSQAAREVDFNHFVIVQFSDIELANEDAKG